MKKRGISVIEFVLIGALVVILTIAFWGKISDMARNLVGLSSVKVTEHSASKEPSLFDNVKDAISALDKNSPDYLNKRVETAGMLGELIAQYNQSKDSSLYSEICNLLKSLAEKDGNMLSDNGAGSCVSSPSSCTTLMTVTDFGWSASSPNKIYYDSKSEKPIYGAFSYDVTYIDNQGSKKTTTITQDVKIQKEKLTKYINKDYTESYVLEQYMPTAYPDSKFTGSATTVQNQINSYMDDKNDELSKTDSDYMCFSNLNTCH